MERIFSKKSLGFKIIAVVVILNFVLTSVPIGVYASWDRADKLKTKATKMKADGGEVDALKNDLRKYADRGKSTAPLILVLSNIVSLLKGPRTGRSNIEHAILDRANGGLFNHSEKRQELEIAMENMLLAIRGLRSQGLSEEIMWQRWTNTLNTELPAKEFANEIDATSAWFKDFLRDKWDIERLARRLVNHIMNIQLKEVIAYSDKYPILQTVLCIGETLQQYKAGRTKEIIEEDLKEILEGISKQDTEKIALRIAYEPRWAIGTGLTPKFQEEIQPAHRFIKDTLAKLIGTELEVDYGGSLSKKNAKEIFALPDVNGSLIGTAAKSPEEIGPVILEGIASGKFLNMGLNDKAENIITGLRPLKEFIELFKRIDLTKVRIVISTPQVKTVKDAMVKFEKTYPRKEVVLERLYPAIVKETKDIGFAYVKEILAPQIKAAEDLLKKRKLEKRFGEKTRKGDVYFLLKKDNRYFALAKENPIDQTLMTAPLLDLSDAKTREEYYANLLEYASIVTTKANKGLELITVTGDELKLRSFLTQKGSEAKARSNSPNVVEENFVLGNLVGTKRWQGDGILEESFFQFEYNIGSPKEGVRPTLLTFKRSDNPKTRGWSAIIQPEYFHITVGFGTEGSQIVKNSRKLGYYVVASNRSANERAAFAQSLGIPLFLLNPEDKKEFDKAGIKAEGTLKDLLDFLESKNEIFLITDATDGEIKDPETGKNITVAEYNKKYIYSKYKYARVMYEGGEDPKIADEFFDVGTLNVLGIPYAEKMKDVKSLFFPSCNTTGYGFVLDRVAFNSQDLDTIGEAIRRIHDPFPQKGKEPIDSIKIDPTYHHAKDYWEGREKYPLLYNAFKKQPSGEPSIFTGATTGPQTKYHVIPIWITGLDKAGKPLTAESVKRFLSDEPRLALVEFKKDVFNLASIGDLLQTKMELMQSYIPIIQVLDFGTGRVQVTMAVPQESIVIPNNMNGIHALTGLYEREASVRLVNDVMRLPKISRKVESSKPLKSARVKPSAPTPEKPTLPFDVLTFDDFDLTGKTVALRGDGNSPVDEKGNIPLTDKFIGYVRTIGKLSESDVAVLDHQGRYEKGIADADYRENFQERAERISKLLDRPSDKPAKYVHDLFGEKAVEAIKAMKDKRGEITMLKNVRSSPEETELSAEQHFKSGLIRSLTPVIDAVVHEDTSVAHRGEQVSVVGWDSYDTPLIAGPETEKAMIEYDRFYKELSKGKVTGIFGGKKIDDYLGLMGKGLENGMFEQILAGGLLNNIALRALGYNLGKATEDVLKKELKKKLPKVVEEVKKLLEKYSDKIIVSKDVAFINKEGKREEVIIEEKHKTQPITEFVIGDIGTLTANDFAERLQKAERIYAKGPVGDYKKAQLLEGSRISWGGIAQSKAIKLRAGTDTETLANKLGVEFDYTSEGGGSMFYYLEKGTLPAWEKLKMSAKYYRGVNKELGAPLERVAGFNKAGRIVYNTLAVESFEDNFIGDIVKLVKEGKLDKKNYALIVTTEYLKVPGIIHIVRALSPLRDKIKIIVLGDNLEKWKVLIGREDIITAKDRDELMARLSENNIINPATDVMLFRLPEETDIAEKLAKLQIRQILSINRPTLEMAKGVTELLSSGGTFTSVDSVFNTFFGRMAYNDKVISEAVYQATAGKVFEKLKEGKILFEFPPELKPEPTVVKETEEARARTTYNEFITEFI